MQGQQPPGLQSHVASLRWSGYGLVTGLAGTGELARRAAPTARRSANLLAQIPA
jgi:flagellar basal body P-ring protein FlgI